MNLAFFSLKSIFPPSAGSQRSFASSAPAQLARRLFSQDGLKHARRPNVLRVRIPSLTQAALAKTSIRS
jgi:hypothetical protein